MEAQPAPIALTLEANSAMESRLIDDENVADKLAEIMFKSVEKPRELAPEDVVECGGDGTAEEQLSQVIDVDNVEKTSVQSLPSGYGVSGSSKKPKSGESEENLSDSERLDRLGSLPAFAHGNSMKSYTMPANLLNSGDKVKEKKRSSWHNFKNVFNVGPSRQKRRSSSTEDVAGTSGDFCEIKDELKLEEAPSSAGRKNLKKLWKMLKLGRSTKKRQVGEAEEEGVPFEDVPLPFAEDQASITEKVVVAEKVQVDEKVVVDEKVDVAEKVEVAEKVDVAEKVKVAEKVQVAEKVEAETKGGDEVSTKTWMAGIVDRLFPATSGVAVDNADSKEATPKKKKSDKDVPMYYMMQV